MMNVALSRCCLVAAGSAALALSSIDAWAQRAVRCSNEIMIRQEPTGYQVTIGDQPMETSVIFETPDRRQVVLSAVGRLSGSEVGVFVVTVDFQSLKVGGYAPPRPGAGTPPSPPTFDYPDCIRLD